MEHLSDLLLSLMISIITVIGVWFRTNQIKAEGDAALHEAQAKQTEAQAALQEAEAETRRLVNVLVEEMREDLKQYKRAVAQKHTEMQQLHQRIDELESKLRKVVRASVIRIQYLRALLQKAEQERGEDIKVDAQEQ